VIVGPRFEWRQRLLRTGSFRLGEQTGTWQTGDAAGNAVTTKRY
jgi:hypothetical protein